MIIAGLQRRQEALDAPAKILQHIIRRGIARVERPKIADFSRSSRVTRVRREVCHVPAGNVRVDRKLEKSWSEDIRCACIEPARDDKQRGEAQNSEASHTFPFRL